jgi:hypothetical protein
MKEAIFTAYSKQDYEYGHRLRELDGGEGQEKRKVLRQVHSKRPIQLGASGSRGGEPVSGLARPNGLAPRCVT